MGKVIKADLMAKGKKFAIIVSRFNEFLSSKLLDGAIDALKQHGTPDNSIDIAWVPGAFEIPFAAQKMAKSKKYDAVICLGVVIKGATPHFDYIAGEVTKGVSKISLDSGVPCMLGVVTADNLEQAIERAGAKQGNKGRDAAVSAIEMANLFEKL
ncbi:MAG: 6,7-dimethyl-8-ribityllumazine synthase [Candidatus Omnitrophota bacterium]|nr:6,7-dimethyl-8-ribityllumazine synthase [Candidatus Omnitrophota bacterium]